MLRLQVVHLVTGTHSVHTKRIHSAKYLRHSVYFLLLGLDVQ